MSGNTRMRPGPQWKRWFVNLLSLTLACFLVILQLPCLNSLTVSQR